MENITAFLTASEVYILSHDCIEGLLVGLDESQEPCSTPNVFQISVSSEIARSVTDNGVDFGIRHITRGGNYKTVVAPPIYEDLKIFGSIAAQYSQKGAKLRLATIDKISRDNRTEYRRLLEYVKRF